MKTGPKYKICRRLGSRVFPQCQTTKFSISGSSQANRRRRAGGRRPNLSDYNRQLLEKQKTRYTYGLKERQLASYVDQISSGGGVSPAEELFSSLERRLDNVVFRFGLVSSRAFARQLVSHGHILVNGRRLNVPSYAVRVGDKISLRPQSRKLMVFNDLEQKFKDYQLPVWLAFDLAEWEGQMLARPKLGEPPSELNFTTILEFYSRV